jgi:hypothetical protein
VGSVDNDDLDVESAATEGLVPLRTGWSIYLHKQDPATPVEDYDKMIKKVLSVYTVQSFWDVWENILPQPSEMGFKCSAHIMRAGIRPMWEDAENALGGMWTFRIAKDQTDLVWRRLVCGMIGEQFVRHVTDGDDIMGASLNIRQPNNSINIWTRKSEDSKGFMTIIRTKILNETDHAPKDIHFKPHKTEFTIDGDNLTYQFHDY